MSKNITFTATDEEAEVIRVQWLGDIRSSETQAIGKRSGQEEHKQQADILKAEAKALEDKARDLRNRYIAIFGPIPGNGQGGGNNPQGK